MNPRQRLHMKVLLMVLLLFTIDSYAQTVRDLIIRKPAYASCNYDTYPDSITTVLTPSPEGKQPFYISHYGRHGSRYISSRKGFDIPYKMITHAGSVNELTPTGQRVLEEMKLVMDDTEGRWGELTGYGKEQCRAIARRMIERFPEVLGGDAQVSSVSTIVPRCIESMGAAMMEMKQVNPRLRITMESSKRYQWYTFSRSFSTSRRPRCPFLQTTRPITNGPNFDAIVLINFLNTIKNNRL